MNGRMTSIGLTGDGGATAGADDGGGVVIDPPSPLEGSGMNMFGLALSFLL